MMKSQSNRAAVRQFGQLSLLSSLRSNSSSKEDLPSKASSSCLSLSDFLDRKLKKSKLQSVQEKQTAFSSVAVGSTAEPEGLKQEKFKVGFLLNEAVFQQFKRKTKEDPVGSSDGGDSGESQLECISTLEDSQKRKNPFAISEGADDRAKRMGYLVVLGDDPKPKKRERGQNFINKKPKTIFNHYANGSGWWDCNMAGIDSEEVGCDNVWEYKGSTTLGGLEWH